MDTALLKYLEENSYLSPLHCAFGEMVGRRSDLKDKPLERTALKLLAAVTLRATAEGHSCLDLSAWKAQFIQQAKKNTTQNVSVETLKAWLNKWTAKCLDLKTNAISLSDAPNTTAPIVVEYHDNKPMVFLRRFHDYEITISTRLKEIIDTAIPLVDSSQKDALKDEIKKANRHFENCDFDRDYQQQAIYNTLQSGLSIITGGPGRGKTTVLSAILALALKKNPSLKIAICAPTGKAASRMKQAIESAMNSTLDTAFIGHENMKTLSDLKPRTVHALLEITQGTDYPKANAENPLDYDLVAVDECSMLSLQMFSQLISALRNGTRLILLGDENQLESVDSGEVLAALCQSLPQTCVNRLMVNYRSQSNTLLCEYTDKLVSSESPDMVHETDVLFSQKELANHQGLFQGIEINSDTKRNLEKNIADFLRLANISVKDAEQTQEMDDMFRHIEKFKILSPVYDGLYGVDNLNAIMRKLLHRNNEYDDGVPILITKNDKITGLLNGDIGVCKNGLVHFKTFDANGREIIRHYSPAQLPEHTCAYAMSIHKSQGSDYENVLMTLPAKNSSFLTKKLIYTGMTRTKKNFMILADKNTLAAAQIHNDHRWSLLAKRIKAQLLRKLHP